MGKAPTNGAAFLAKVFHDAYQQAELEVGRFPVAGWETLSPDDRKTMAVAFQKLIDLEIIRPITLQGVRRLRTAGWQSVVPTREKNERPGNV